MNEPIMSRLDADFKTAMKEKKQEELLVIRQLRSAIQNEEIKTQKPLTDEEVMTVVLREHKKLNDALTDFQNAGREDLAEKNQSELAIIQRYLPTPLSEEELEATIKEIVEKARAEGEVHQGKLTGEVMKQVKGRASAAQVASILSRVLGS